MAGGVGGPVTTGAAFIDRLPKGKKLTAIRTCGGQYVDSVQLYIDGAAQPRRGGPGGFCSTVALDADEVIQRVTGYARGVVNQLSYVTNRRTIGPYGSVSGDEFSMKSSDPAVFRGLSGASGTVNFQGTDILVLAQLNLVGAASGGPGGTAFMDRLEIDEKVKKIIICYGAANSDKPYVHSIQFETTAGLRPRRGTDWYTPTCSETTLDHLNGEYIVELFGTAGQYVDSLGFATNQGKRVAAVGTPSALSNGFSHTVKAKNRFAGWHGSAGGWLDSVALMDHPAGDTSSVVPAKPIRVFSDQLPSATDVVNKIVVCTYTHPTYNTEVVKSVQAFLPSVVGPEKAMSLHGGPGGTCSTVNFAVGEFITEMFGLGGGGIDRIAFRTNSGNEYGPFGGGGGNPFLIRNPSSTKFLGFAGRYLFNGGLVAIDFSAPTQFAPVLPANSQAATLGWWSNLAEWPINAIHASVLNDGRVMNYGTGPSGAQGALFVYDVWSPPTDGVGVGEHMVLPNTTGTDLFCSAQTLFPNGELLLAGGDNRYNAANGYNNGVADVNIFKKVNNVYTLAKQPQSLRIARWYATQTMLPSGRVLVTGGIDQNGAPVSTPEIYNPASKTWTAVTGITDTALNTFYPRVFVGPRAAAAGVDEVFVIPTGGSKIYRMSIDANVAGRLTDTNVVLPGTQPGIPATHNWQHPAIQFDAGKLLLHVFVQGAINPNTGMRDVDSKAVAVVNLPTAVGAQPTTFLTNPLTQARNWANFVLLPTGEVLAIGGSKGDGQLVLDGEARHVEIWNPATGQWRTGAAELRPRLYHSTAVLLHDGRVLSAGGGAPGPVLNLNAQFYSPPYLYRPATNGTAATRPTFTGAPGFVPYNATFTFNVPPADTVQAVTLTRLGSVTHSFDFDARFLKLTVVQNVNGVWTVRGPANRYAAPPGQYLLSVVNASGVPSVGKVVVLE